MLRTQNYGQALRQTGTITDHTFETQFLAPGLQAFAFTLG
jgi:hypothetical protein